MSINANELRVNNWYRQLHTGKESQVTLFLLGEIADDESYLDHLFPIPLSPEVLLACGFAQSFTSDPQEPDASQVFEINWLSIHQHSEKENKFFWYNGDVEMEIKSLHQLQNLYFALTGKELEYNPNQSPIKQ